MAVEKIKILGAALEILAKQHCQFMPFCPIFLVNGPNWQCYLAGSSKFFSIALGAKYSFYVKSIATYAPPKVDMIITLNHKFPFFKFFLAASIN